MLKELVGEGTELGNKREQMIVIFYLTVLYIEEWLSGDKLKYKATETLDISDICHVMHYIYRSLVCLSMLRYSGLLA